MHTPKSVSMYYNINIWRLYHYNILLANMHVLLWMVNKQLMKSVEMAWIHTYKYLKRYKSHGQFICDHKYLNTSVIFTTKNALSFMLMVWLYNINTQWWKWWRIGRRDLKGGGREGRRKWEECAYTLWLSSSCPSITQLLHCSSDYHGADKCSE